MSLPVDDESEVDTQEIEQAREDIQEDFEDKQHSDDSHRPGIQNFESEKLKSTPKSQQHETADGQTDGHSSGDSKLASSSNKPALTDQHVVDEEIKEHRQAELADIRRRSTADDRFHDIQV